MSKRNIERITSKEVQSVKMSLSNVIKEALKGQHISLS